MNSATYQQSSLANHELKQDDPDNRLFARWLPRRAESELIRDSILFKSDRLELASRGPNLESRTLRRKSRLVLTIRLAW